MFPYPSGHGLHVGHLKGYVASDVVTRYKRMRGFEVLHPMGWDSFGLPTERQAERDHLHPAEVTRRNVAVFRKQLTIVGLSYDWDREIATSDPSYYKFTQWIFLKLLERGLAVQADVPVNWCPALGTVLANEEVKDGRYVETGDPVEKRVMRQWMLRITAYADRLLDDLDLVDWPDAVKKLQRDWIGRSEGALVRFDVAGHDASFEVFTTRADTLFGCTFCVLAPEHALVAKIATGGQRAEVEAYAARAAARSDRERIAQAESKTGVFTGAYALNPVNGARVPIWTADYVLGGYGTGAVFGCPAHDGRDYAFARLFGLAVVEVVAGGDVSVAPYVGDGPHVRSELLDGLDTAAAKERIHRWLAEHGKGKGTVTYHLRDWLFSRQRYWGEPIPVLYTPDGAIVPDDRLPVILPESLDDSDAPAAPSTTGEGPSAPLARAGRWLEADVPGKAVHARRETNVMPQWAGSCWYYLRFLDPNNADAAWDPALEKRWMPVDLYLGGIEQATLHLLYARFWHKVLYDCGLVSTKEPFQKLYNQGMVHARSYRDERGKYYYPDRVVERDGAYFSKEGGAALESRIEKMSKSRYNTVAPEDVIAEYGADSLRLYEAFMGPVEENGVWQTDGLPGMRRFLDRVWKLFEKPVTGAIDAELERLLHKSIRKVTDDIEGMRLNTAVSQLMILVNAAMDRREAPRALLDALVLLLAPFAPHFAEELWSRSGHATPIAHAPWPELDPAKCIDDQVEVVVQVNGKVRAHVRVERGASQEMVEQGARADEAIRRSLAEKAVSRVIFVQDRLVNFVVK
jgi:leucyl-tRNA synthetase